MHIHFSFDQSLKQQASFTASVISKCWQSNLKNWKITPVIFVLYVLKLQFP